MTKWLMLLLLTAVAAAQTDGPASLPQRTPATSFSSPNPAITVVPPMTLQAVVNAAQCGDNIILPHGTQWAPPTYPTTLACTHDSA